MRKSAFAILLPLFVLAAQPAPVHPRDDPASGRSGLSGIQRANHAHAVQSFREHRFAAAYGRFARLADAGHEPSARVALLMAENGPELFGSDWSASAAQRRHWRALMINGARAGLDTDDNVRGD